MRELLGPGGRSIKRLLPIIAFAVLFLVLIVSFIPIIQIPDNNKEVILEVVSVMGWVIGVGFSSTAIESFNRKGRGRSRITKTKDIDENSEEEEVTTWNQ